MGTQNWKFVDPLIAKNASVTFSNGTIHRGKENVRKAFEKNFSLIKNEEYTIEKINWPAKDEKCAVYLFDFHWKGVIQEKLVTGNGIGTSVIIHEDSKWQLLTEHLGRKHE